MRGSSPERIWPTTLSSTRTLGGSGDEVEVLRTEQPLELGLDDVGLPGPGLTPDRLVAEIELVGPRGGGQGDEDEERTKVLCLMSTTVTDRGDIYRY